MNKETNKIFIFGVTGSMGRMFLETIEKNFPEYEITGISFLKNLEIACEILDDHPEIKVVWADKKIRSLLAKKYPQILVTSDAKDALIHSQATSAVNAIVGFAGLEVSLAVIKQKIKLFLCNKETLVVAGKIIYELSEKYDSEIQVVDSEHIAIQQALIGEEFNNVDKIILTASGGPFLNFEMNQITGITVADTINHPVWTMGKKISVDSATMFNKALEIIEAYWIFKSKKIEVLIHPQAIVHGIIEFKDGFSKAILSPPDMKLCIQHVLANGNRSHQFATQKKVDFHNLNLTFSAPELNSKHRSIKLAYHCLDKLGIYPVVLNAANEIAVHLFLKEKISFVDIYYLVESAIDKCENIINPTVNDIYNTHNWTVNYILNAVEKDKK